MATTKPAGLEGIVAGDTEICSVAQGDLIYRGYEISDLAENATFEEVAYLLLEGHKPDANQLRFFKDELISNRALPPQAIDTLKTCAPMLEPDGVVAAREALVGAGGLATDGLEYVSNLFSGRHV